MKISEPIRFIDWLPEREEYFPHHGGDAPTQAQLDAWMGSMHDAVWAARLGSSPRLIHALRMLGYIYCKRHGWNADVYRSGTKTFCRPCSLHRSKNQKRKKTT